MRERWYERLRETVPRIALADGADERARIAAKTLAGDKLIRPVLVVESGANDEVAEGVEIVQCEVDEDPLMRAMTMVSDGEAAGCVAGATRPTSDVLRAAIKTVGRAPGVELISSSFLMILDDDRTIAYADCGVVPDPNEKQLASIAVSAAHTFEELTGQQARVAMLSFSTHGSSTHASVEKVRAATELVRSQAPELVVDGELQFDAAFVPDVAQRKAPDSILSGTANVFVFPNLGAANIAYKITERIGGATALGPLLQGLAAPVHDLSRGCSAEDIYEISAIAGFQALTRQVAT